MSRSSTPAGRATAYAQTPVGGSRPTLGLLAGAFGHLEGAQRLNPVQLANRPSFLGGTLTLLNDGAPLPERPVSISLPLCLALRGDEAGWPGGLIDEGTGHLPLPDTVLAGCRQQATALSCETAPVLVLRSAALEEARAAAAAIAHALHKRAFVADTIATAGLAAWLLLRDLVPVFVVDPGPGETKTLPAGTYRAELTVKDSAGRTAARSINFRTE